MAEVIGAGMVLLLFNAIMVGVAVHQLGRIIEILETRLSDD